MYGRCGLELFSYPTYFFLVGVEYFQTAGVLRASLSFRLFLRYVRRAKRIRLRAFEKALRRPPYA
ncbi:hypothetical protein DWQ65_08590 [Treponema phagedenis]|uniref:Uncharacterized protein n=1 Tax=Treponema phagedenis TaxID=162 RepID=A0AAE6IVK8_TREPH|nr:hypothetical protein FUT79_02785 [Treponema phagedenis]QEJ99174.1 hypothetical protein FUT82_15035 [Treponema phagedenis]QEK04702.1 hypothetical protein FUT83_13435 [Treponema phagedenis]QEK10360.1 hypothetical protein FUT81_13570 [Treponema phagedenis]QSI00117.1 hypothetical protein DWQ65_08590 [Treponema phagedenis]